MEHEKTTVVATGASSTTVSAHAEASESFSASTTTTTTHHSTTTISGSSSSTVEVSSSSIEVQGSSEEHSSFSAQGSISGAIAGTASGQATHVEVTEGPGWAASSISITASEDGNTAKTEKTQGPGWEASSISITAGEDSSSTSKEKTQGFTNQAGQIQGGTCTSATTDKPAPAPAPATPAPAQPRVHVQKRIRAGELGARGVNLGGWLVAEQWMSAGSDMWKDVPEGFQGEYQVLVHGNDKEARIAKFEQHHATFITEADIAAIAKAGFNLVRVPVGYWIAGSDDGVDEKYGNLDEWKAFPKNAATYLDKLVKEWAVTHNVAVLVDIHAAKGSQNGDQHSAPTVNGQAYWGQYPENVITTINVVKFLADRYKNDEAFLGLGLLNDPAAQTDEKVLHQYHQDAYKAIRESDNDCIVSVMPIRWKQEPDNLVGFMEAPEYKNVWVEWHPYFIWSYENKSGDELIKQSVLTEFQEKVNKWNSRPNANKLFIGEWSLANTGQFRDGDAPEFQDWARAQVSVMNQAKAGWAYWSWHLEGDEKEDSFEAWSLRSVLRKEPVRQILLQK
ncbi:hypothetical protein Poli38472_011997 [Pythium oligandrum]|uniref:glucan 1,3-beta-glucosidase n=1 Tax=Pythium oligandrum TaxID=41045 RepID=A0A8K1CQK6_PYTOL|nr:hypothetical protein Poli38472_011997 [Pythium oligandrum]|eukprot:TMW66881.1 hypothetical protein Poli38472_011997 [Pythium oligandrum]